MGKIDYASKYLIEANKIKKKLINYNVNNEINLIKDIRKVFNQLDYKQKKSSKENAPAVVGIELKHPSDLAPLMQRMKQNNFFGDYLNDKPDLFQYLV